jgi:hypothetical protein
MICSYKYCKNVLKENEDINSKTNEYYKRCLICRSRAKCIHKFEKNNCKICCGIMLCEHNKIPNKCSLCSKNLCEHKKFKFQCIECRNIQLNICSHNKQTFECYICNGKNLCPHNLNPNKCLECGNGNCICTKCTNVFQQVDGETFKRCATCREIVKKSTAKKLTTNTTETTNCCTNCHSSFDIIINAKTKKEYKTCNVCREKDDERRKLNPEKRMNYYKQNSEKEKLAAKERNKRKVAINL